MSAFDYCYYGYQLDEAEERLDEEIREKRYSDRVIEDFKKGLETLKAARIYLHQIDQLLEARVNEDAFRARLERSLEDSTFGL